MRVGIWTEFETGGNMTERMTPAEKMAEYEWLRQEAHKKVDILNRQQLRKFISNNGPQKAQKEKEQ